MNNNNENSALNKPAVSCRLISEAILNDKQLQQLNAKRVEIYSLATPTVILGKKAETVWIDEINYLLLSKINEMIDQRTEQIKRGGFNKWLLTAGGMKSKRKASDKLSANTEV